MAAEFRKLAEGTFTRVMSGDLSVIEAIEAYAAPSAPVNLAFREALAKVPAEPVRDDMAKKRKLDRQEREENAKIRTEELRDVHAFADIMAMLNPAWRKDGRLRLRTEAWVKNVVFIDSSTIPLPFLLLLPARGRASPALALRLILRKADSIAIGKRIAKAYLDKIGKKSYNHRQWVDGAGSKDNSYTEEDRASLRQPSLNIWDWTMMTVSELKEAGSRLGL